MPKSNNATNTTTATTTIAQRSRTFQPTADQLAIVRQLKALADAEKSHAEFVRQYCDFGPTKLSKIFSLLDPGAAATSYFDDIKDPDSELNSLELLLTEIRNQRAAVARSKAVDLYPLPKFRAVAQAVREAKNKTNPERIIKYLAPTGGGKSMLCNYLANLPGISARVVEAREVWKSSYFQVLSDFMRALGLRLKSTRTTRTQLESKLIEAGNARQIVLVIDEAEFFSDAALNGIKLLLNKARFTIVICAIPEAHDKWNDRYPHEADQIARRTHAIVELSTVQPGDVALFFDPVSSCRGDEAADKHSSNSNTKFADCWAAYQSIADAASQFGHFSLVARVADKLRAIDRADSRDVDKAIASARKQMLRQTPTPKS